MQTCGAGATPSEKSEKRRMIYQVFGAQFGDVSNILKLASPSNQGVSRIGRHFQPE